MKTVHPAIRTLVIASCVVALAAPAVLAADQTAAMGRKILSKNADAVVSVEALLNITITGAGMPARKQERKVEVLATVIHPSGLTVTSLSRLSPASLYDGRSVNVRGNTVQVSTKTVFTDVKIRLADGAEVPAKVVLKDTDFDLAFILPDAAAADVKPRKFTFIDCSRGGKAQPLDRVFRLMRLDEDFKRLPAISVGRIAAVVPKPRRFYLGAAGAPGTPVFLGDGKLLGISLLRRPGRKQSPGDVTPIILPAEEVQYVAKQALEELPKAAATTKPAATSTTRPASAATTQPAAS